jgi:hypothetical protein
MAKYQVALIAECEAESLEEARKIVYGGLEEMIFPPGTEIELLIADDSRTAKSGERIVILPPADEPEEV